MSLPLSTCIHSASFWISPIPSGHMATLACMSYVSHIAVQHHAAAHTLHVQQ